MVHKEKHVGDVNKIKFCGQSVFMTASSNGSVSLHHIASRDNSSDDVAVRTQKTWDTIHSGGGRSVLWKNIDLSLICRSDQLLGDLRHLSVAVLIGFCGYQIRRLIAFGTLLPIPNYTATVTSQYLSDSVTYRQGWGVTELQ